MLCRHHLLSFVILAGWIQYSSQSAPTPLTQADKLAWLNDHNVVRCQQNAVTMPALIWDDALEKVAQAWANTCPSGHNANAGSQYQQYSGLSGSIDVGENYAAGYSTPEAGDAAWAAEKPQMGGHYTQMVWADSLRLGCARNTVACGSYGTYYLCEYYPPGNYIGEQPFVTGGSSNTDACTYQARTTDFPTMVWNNGVGTVVNAINGVSGAPAEGTGTAGTQAPATQPPATQPPATQPPATRSPTQPPATQPPATQPPATQPPATSSPVTYAPPSNTPTSAPNTTPAPGTPTSAPSSGNTPAPGTPTTDPSSGNTPAPGTNNTPAPGTTVAPTSTPTDDPNSSGALNGAAGNTPSSSSSTNTGAIIGVVVGMIAGVVIIALVAFFVYRRYSSSVSWSTSKTHLSNFQPYDANRYQGNTKAPQPLTSISTTTPSQPAGGVYTPGNVFNPTSFGQTNNTTAYGAAGGAAVQGTWANHQKQEDMDNYQSNPALSAMQQQDAAAPAIPTSRPQIPMPVPPTRPQQGVTPFPPSQPRSW